MRLRSGVRAALLAAVTLLGGRVAAATPPPPPPPTGVLADLVLSTRGPVKDVLREDLLAFGAPAREELDRRAGSAAAPVERWLAGALLARAAAPDEAARLTRAWADAVAGLLHPDGRSGGEYPGMNARTRIDLAKLPASKLWPAMFAEWAALGWTGPDPFRYGSDRRWRYVEAHRFHALLALADLGESRAAPFLAEVVRDGSLSEEQRLAAARGLARVAPDGADAALAKAPMPGWAPGVRDPAFVPFLARREAFHGPGNAREGWKTAHRLEAIAAAHPDAFEHELDRAARVVLALPAGGPDARHRTGHATGTGWTATRGEDKAGHVLFGPYANLPAGRYLARFRLRCSRFDGTRHELEIDVCHRRGHRVAASRSVGGWDLEEGAWKDVFLGFADPGDAGTELRVDWDGRCDVEIDSVTVYSVAPAPEEATVRAWSPPDPTARPAPEQTAAAEHLFRRAAATRDAEYAAFREALFRLGDRARDVLEAVPDGDPDHLSASLLASRMADPDAFATADSAFLAALTEASRRIESFRSVRGAYLDWAIAAEPRRSVTIAGEAGDAPPVVAADDLTPWDKEVLERWEANRRLEGSPYLRRALSELALHGWVNEPESYDPPPPEVVSFHALMHAVRLGEDRLLPRLAKIAKDPAETAGRRGAAIATIACVRPGDAEAWLRSQAGAAAPAEVRGRTVAWLARMRVAAARPWLWRQLGEDLGPRGAGSPLAALSSTSSPADKAAEADAAALEEVASFDGKGAALRDLATRDREMTLTIQLPADAARADALVVRVSVVWKADLGRASRMSGSISDPEGRTSLSGPRGLGIVALDREGKRLELAGLAKPEGRRALRIRVAWNSFNGPEAPTLPPDGLAIERVRLFRLRAP